jgi:hypothetical protein
LNQLLGISCATATHCIAVGEYNDGTIWRTLTESWNGTLWSVVPSPNPDGSLNFLSRVGAEGAARSS